MKNKKQDATHKIKLVFLEVMRREEKNNDCGKEKVYKQTQRLTIVGN
jgi:FtsZ-binding cell division protein ZapB